jgi:subtilisin family serine protease
VSFPTRPLRPSVVVALVVAALLAGMSSAGIVAARAPDRAGTVRASDASAPGGRLIVFWKNDRKPNLSLPLVASARSSSVGAHRSVVKAAPGQAAALAAKLRADPDVAAVVPDVILSATDWPGGDPNDPDYASQGDLPQIGMPTAWPTTIGAQTAVIAILDTGTTVNHEDLLSTKFVDAFDVVHRMSGAVDDNVTGPDGVGHGTHVTGTIAAQANNGVGIAGMAPGVSIMPIKVLDSSGTGGLAEILDGIDYARLHGADVINMSLGGRAERFDSTSLAEFQATINTAYAAGITIVAAAGNDGDGTVEYPCAFVHVICVGATDNSDNHAFFSNTNAYVDISAPGWNILSTVPTSVDPTGYHSLSGTSMATPHVAALAGLIRSIYPSETVDQVEATILSTAQDLGDPGRDNVFGAGRINAAAAVNLAPPDLIAPVMTGLTSPSLVRSASRAFTATWTATDNVGVTSYEIRMKKGASGTWSAVSSQPESSRRFSLAAGSWYIAVRAVDGAGRRSAWRQVLTIVPKDDRAWAFSSGTLRKVGLAYINGTETRTSRAGARMTVRFTGSAFYLLGTSAVRRGKLRVTIDGRSWIVDEGMYRGARARSTNYRVLLFARSLTNRTHTAVITCLATYGRPTIDVDAVAWRN